MRRSSADAPRRLDERVEGVGLGLALGEHLVDVAQGVGAAILGAAVAEDGTDR